MHQKTIKNTVYAEGIGIHSGKAVRLTLSTAPDDTGIVFRRKQADKFVEMPVCVDKIIEVPMCTMMVYDDCKISTIEHLMSALAALEIDNIYIDLDGNEVPIMDGSASPFIFLIQSAGILEQAASRRYIRIKKPVRITEEDKFAELLPYSHGFCIHASIDQTDPVIQATNQELIFDFSTNGYIKEISRARTYGYAAQLAQLHQNNLALGASLDNAIGIDDTGVMNPEGLRYPDEFIRHKLLDCVGDLYVAGPIRGMFRGHKMGHALNNRVLRKLLATEDAREWQD